MNFLFVRLLSILLFISFSSMLLLYFLSHRHGALDGPPKTKRILTRCKKNEIIHKLLANYSSEWKKQEKNIKSYSSLLNKKCSGISNALVTQKNSPVKRNITYDGDGKKLLVEPTLFKLFLKESPFKKAQWDSCAVVGNGGIIANSSCGKQIDSATYVIRCNLPPLSGKYERDAGRKTSLVTANPSIFHVRYRGLNKQQQKSFLRNMQMYGNASLLLPAFSFWAKTNVSLRAFHSLLSQRYKGPRAAFLNPSYLKCLPGFWSRHGVRARRLSTGLMMVSLAMELCSDVHLYGFWPFGRHPYTQQSLSNHYYDNQPVNEKMHAMPSEFKALLDLHNQGVIHLHLGKCTS